MIVGLDRDGPDVFQRTLRFLDSARIDALQLNIMTPLPGKPHAQAHFENVTRIPEAAATGQSPAP